MSKYHNRKTVADDMVFDSRAEARRWQELRILERAGEIAQLQRQVPFVLIKGQRWSNGKKHRDTVYKADFVYWDNQAGKKVVEDVKGVRTDAYRIKRELMKSVYGIEIEEVEA